MYMNNTINTIRKIGIILSLILGFMLISSTETNAQNRDSRDYNNYYGYNSYGPAADIARKYGYQDGLNDGADAAREGDRYHPQNSGDWQKGTNGYESRYGSKGAYKQAYRQAYMEGYNAAYQRRNNNRARNGYRNY